MSACASGHTCIQKLTNKQIQRIHRKKSLKTRKRKNNNNKRKENKENGPSNHNLVNCLPFPPRVIQGLLLLLMAVCEGVNGRFAPVKAPFRNAHVLSLTTPTILPLQEQVGEDFASLHGRGREVRGWA